MAKYITEVLKEINDDPSLFNTMYRKVGDGGPLGVMFKHAFTAQGKFLLPEGKPPFKEDPAPLGMSPSRFITEIKKFYIFCRTDLSPLRRETIFIQLLESIHPLEAEILIAIKDQNLTDLYPNITRKCVADAGFIPPLSPEELQKEVEIVKPSARPRGRPRKSVSPQPVQ